MDTEAGAGKYLPALQDKEMEGVVKERICKDKGKCLNGRCLYRKAHTEHRGGGRGSECLPFPCSFLGATQHCEPVNKEGIMEDNRKGTWEDVTDECIIDDNGVCGFVEVRHNGVTVGWLGHRVEGSLFQGNYRMTSSLDPEDARYGDCGKFKVEHFTPDPEPVIAYKAVRVENGEYLSVLTGSRAGEDFHGSKGKLALRYIVGESISAPGAGIFCLESLDWAMNHYVTGSTLRASGPVAILEVEGIGRPVMVNTTRPAGSVNYPSVKVLSVAWEEEKKEEWVDVTGSLVASMGIAGYVNIFHHGTCVLSVGGSVHADSAGLADYRITTTEAGAAGRFKVEKRNG